MKNTWLCSTGHHSFRGRSESAVILTAVSPNFLKHPISRSSNVLGQHFSLLGTLQIPNVVPCLKSLVLLKIRANYNKRKHNNQPNPIKLLISFCARYLLGPLCLFWQQSFALKGKKFHLLSSEGVNALKKENICLFGVYERLEDPALPALEMDNLHLPHG